jgi:hypothetical protein
MTPIRKPKEKNRIPSEPAGFDLQAAYLVLIRAWVKRQSKEAGSEQGTAPEFPPLP